MIILLMAKPNESTITVTFGDVAENGTQMEQLGKKYMEYCKSHQSANMMLSLIQPIYEEKSSNELAELITRPELK